LIPQSTALEVSMLTITPLIPQSTALEVSTLTITPLIPQSTALEVSTLTITPLMQSFGHITTNIQYYITKSFYSITNKCIKSNIYIYNIKLQMAR
jgi:hypothetical protein